MRPSAPFRTYTTRQNLPIEFLPGKRALAIGLCIYHSIASTILYQAPRFIPYSLGPAFESYVCRIHSICGLTSNIQAQHHAGGRMGHAARRAWPWDGGVVARHASVCCCGKKGCIVDTWRVFSVHGRCSLYSFPPCPSSSYKFNLNHQEAHHTPCQTNFHRCMPNVPIPERTIHGRGH